jgi:hypothetical protein
MADDAAFVVRLMRWIFITSPRLVCALRIVMSMIVLAAANA